MEDSSKSKKFDYRYVVIAISAAIIFLALGFCSSSKKIFLEPILSYTGISSGLYGFSDSFRHVTTAIVNLFFASLIVKFGIKKLLAAGFISLVSSMLLFALSKTVVGFYLAGALLGLGVSWTTTTMISYLINSWCTKNKGKILGLVLAANGLGGATATMLLSPIIQATPSGYKTAYFIIAILVAVLGVIAVVFLKDNPHKTLSNEQTQNKRSADWSGIDMATAKKKPYFYVALPLQTIVLPIYASDLFGNKDYTKFLGLCVSFNALGAVLSSPITGFFYDAFSSYTPSIFLSGILLSLAFIGMQYVVTCANKEKKLAALNGEPTKNE